MGAVQRNLWSGEAIYDIFGYNGVIMGMQEHARKLLATLERYLHTDMQYILRGGGWIAGGQIIGMFLSFAGAVAFANIFEKEEYGTYKYILSMMAIFAIPALSGMGVAMTQAVARGEHGSFLPAFRAKVSWGLLGSLGSILFGAYYLLFTENSLIGYAFLVVAPFIPLMEAFTLWSSYFAGTERFKESAIANVLIQTGATLITITTLVASKSVLLVLLAYVLSYTIFRHLTHRYILAHFAELRTTNNVHAAKAISFGKHLSLIAVISTVIGQLDYLLLWHFLGSVPLAVYAFAQATTTPAKTFFKILTTLATPRFSNRSSEELKASIPKKILQSFAIFVPVVIVYILILPYLYELFFPKYLDSVMYAQALGLIFLIFPAKILGTAISTRENKRAVYILNTINPIMNTVLLAILIPIFGVWGAVATTILQHIGSLGTSYWFFRKMRD